MSAHRAALRRARPLESAYISKIATVPLLIIDDLGMRKLPPTAAEDLLEIIVTVQGWS